MSRYIVAHQGELCALGLGNQRAIKRIVMVAWQALRRFSVSCIECEGWYLANLAQGLATVLFCFLRALRTGVAESRLPQSRIRSPGIGVTVV
jgi:hypothetical protein